jgi:hypothetical protein
MGKETLSDEGATILYAAQCLLGTAEYWSAYYREFMPDSPHGLDWDEAVQRRRRIAERVSELDMT